MFFAQSGTPERAYLGMLFCFSCAEIHKFWCKNRQNS